MRIIAGIYKGRDLLPPPGKSSTRPITGSVKKSLFGMLGEDLTGQFAADLFCGTGTLGIEALSRGAAHCCFAERDPRVAAVLMRNLQDCRATQHATIWRGDVTRDLERWLAELDRPLDLAFVDPPYVVAQEWWPGDAKDSVPSRASIVDDVFTPLAGRLAEDGIVVVRTDNRAVVPENLGPLSVIRVRQYGNMVVRLLKKALGTRQ